MTQKAVRTDAAPKAIGPYSQGIDAGDYVFVSGQAGIDPLTGKVADGIVAQTELALKNVDAVLSASGCTWGNVVKVTLWLTSADHFTTVNEIYALVVGDPAPARSAPIVAALPRGLLISVEAIAKR
jgi:2-iminobutanoate/2-iminopropanoate deaminase